MNLHLYPNITINDFEKVLNALPNDSPGAILWKEGKSVFQDEEKVIIKIRELLSDKIRVSLPPYISDNMVAKILSSLLENYKASDHALKDIKVVKKLFSALPYFILGGGKLSFPEKKDESVDDIKKASYQLIEFFFQLKPIADHEIKIIAKAFFQNKNPIFLKTLLEDLQKIVLDLFKDRNESIFEVFIGWVLSLIPFLEPDNESFLIVPQKKGCVWRLIEYKIEEIKLTPSFLGSPMKAYGLIKDLESPLLLFMGTPQRTASGSLLSIWGDFVPGFSVGELPFKLFHKKIVGKWLEENTKGGKHPAII